MFEEVFKEGLKKALENGVFVVFLTWLAYDMKQDQKQMIIANELRNQKTEKVLLEHIDKITKEKNELVDDLIKCHKGNDN